MNKTPAKSGTKAVTPSAPATEQDDDDIFEDGEITSLPEGIDKETVKRDARRKIEIYWEKRRLREQFDDFDESEFGFWLIRLFANNDYSPPAFPRWLKQLQVIIDSQILQQNQITYGSANLTAVLILPKYCGAKNSDYGQSYRQSDRRDYPL